MNISNPTTTQKKQIKLKTLYPNKNCNNNKMSNTEKKNLSKDEWVYIKKFKNEHPFIIPQNKILFHAWCVDNDTGNIIDDYLDKTKDIGKVINLKKSALRIKDIVHRQFGKNDNVRKQLRPIIKNIELYFADKIMCKYLNLEYDSGSYDHLCMFRENTYIYCLVRAFIIHKRNPEKYKLQLGRIYYVFPDGKKKTEMDDDDRMKILNYMLVSYKLELINNNILSKTMHWINPPPNIIQNICVQIKQFDAGWCGFSCVGCNTELYFADTNEHSSFNIIVEIVIDFILHIKENNLYPDYEIAKKKLLNTNRYKMPESTIAYNKVIHDACKNCIYNYSNTSELIKIGSIVNDIYGLNGMQTVYYGVNRICIYLLDMYKHDVELDTDVAVEFGAFNKNLQYVWDGIGEWVV